MDLFTRCPNCDQLNLFVEGVTACNSCDEGYEFFVSYLGDEDLEAADQAGMKAVARLMNWFSDRRGSA